MARTRSIHGQIINDWSYRAPYVIQSGTVHLNYGDAGGELTDGLMDVTATDYNPHWSLYQGGDVTVRLDLAEPRSIGWVGLWTMRRVSALAELPSRMQVYGSTDDITWTLLSDVSFVAADHADQRVHRLTAYSGTQQTYRYIRLVITPNGAHRVALGEVHVFDVQPTASPTYTYNQPPSNGDKGGWTLYDWAVDDTAPLDGSRAPWVRWHNKNPIEIVFDWGEGRQKRMTAARLRFLRHDYYPYEPGGTTFAVSTSDDGVNWTHRGSQVLTKIATNQTAEWMGLDTAPVSSRYVKISLTGMVKYIAIDEAEIEITDHDNPTPTTPPTVRSSRVIVMFI